MSQTGVSVWTETAPQPAAKALRANEQADVCVVGAGIAGLTTAYLLAKAGRRVVVLEAKETISPGETAYTTAHLACVLDDRFSEVERIRGEEVLRLAVQSHAHAIDHIERTAAAEGIDCDFRRVDGFLFLGPSSEADLLDKEADSARRAGLAFERLASAPLPGGPTRACLRFPGQGQFHPLRYLAGLHRAIERLGGLVFTGCPVKQILPGSPCQVLTRSGRAVTAAAVVVATNTPINDVVALHTKQAPYMTYAYAARVPAGHVPAGLYWDTEDPYHYVRLQPAPGGGEFLIVGGADHKTGQHGDPREHWERIERWGRAHFPQMGEVLYRWSGQVMETIDGLGFIGPDPGGQQNVFIATGDSGMGMTHGTIAGILLCDLIQKRDNPWASVYDPARKPLAAAGEFLRENVNVAAQYLDWVTGGEVSSADQIPPGKGAVIRRGLTKLAVYRDDGGEVHQCSAVCPHLGCVVHWNDPEKTWDCPCHGSRFSAEGKVQHGPATSDLEQVHAGSTRSG